MKLKIKCTPEQAASHAHLQTILNVEACVFSEEQARLFGYWLDCYIDSDEVGERDLETLEIVLFSKIHRIKKELAAMSE